jgi:hypothetical protein
VCARVGCLKNTFRVKEMESQGEYFRQKFLECLHAAQQTSEQTSKALLLALAQQWRQLAEASERRPLA